MGRDHCLDSWIGKDARIDLLSANSSRSLHVSPGRELFKQDRFGFVFPTYPLAKLVHLPGISRSSLEEYFMLYSQG